MSKGKAFLADLKAVMEKHDIKLRVEVHMGSTASLYMYYHDLDESLIERCLFEEFCECDIYSESIGHLIEAFDQPTSVPLVIKGITLNQWYTTYKAILKENGLDGIDQGSAEQYQEPYSEGCSPQEHLDDEIDAMYCGGI